jgi:hypothetical protein
LASLVAFAAGVLLFARVGALRGESLRLYALTSQARGVIKGTEVWVAGQKVGLVETVRFRPPTADTSARVVLVLDVLRDHSSQIRRDSYGQIRAGGTLIGAPVVFISSGSPTAPLLADGDTLATRPQSDVDRARTRLALATQDLPAIVTNLRTIGSQVTSARGTAGAILNLDPSERQLGVLQKRASRLTRSVTAGRGTVALALGRGNGGLAARARAVIARTDSVRALLASPDASLGRFRRDSTLLRELTEIQAEISITRALLAEPRGTAGRLLADSALVGQLAQFDREVGLLLREVKRRPARFVVF